MNIPQADGLILSARQNDVVKKWMDTWTVISKAEHFVSEAVNAYKNEDELTENSSLVSADDSRLLKEALGRRADLAEKIVNNKEMASKVERRMAARENEKEKKGCAVVIWGVLTASFGLDLVISFFEMGKIQWVVAVCFVFFLLIFLDRTGLKGRMKRDSLKRSDQRELAALSSKLSSLEEEYKNQSSEAYRILEKVKKSVAEIVEKRKKELEEFRTSHLKTDPMQPYLGDYNETMKKFQPILKPDKSNMPDHLVIGFWKDKDDQKKYGDLWFPMFGKQRGVILRYTEKCRDGSLIDFQQIAQRLYTLLPHHSLFTFIDPLGAGAAFPMQRDVNARVQESDAYHTLENISKDMVAVTVASALTEADPFYAHLDKTILNAKFEFIFINDFPEAYDQRTIDKIVNIANNGYISGKYVFIRYNSDQPLPRDFKMEVFKSPIIVDRAFYDEQNTLYYGNRQMDSAFYYCAKQEVWDQIVAHIKAFKPEAQKVEFDKVSARKEENFWTESSLECIETTVGEGGGQALNIWLGSKDNRNCSHGMLAAMTGAGKSNFYHALILSLAQRYSPDELSLYLIDGKQGVEFQVYKDFPHAKVVSLRTSSELAGSVLEELVEEMGRRNKCFKKAGLNDIISWRRKTGEKMPRVLLVIDEYQVLFPDRTSPETTRASELLATLASQGRSAGIHLLLGSQRFVVPDMQKKDAVFANIQLRIAMKMSDVSSLEEFKKEGREAIARFDQPGQIIINQNSGENGFNQIGKVVLMDQAQKDKIVSGICRKSAENKLQVPPTVVFDGDIVPRIQDNMQLLTLRDMKDRRALKELARRSEHEGGFGKELWNEECTAIGWMGQEFNMYGNASLVLSRDDSENVMIVSDKTPARYGMLLGLLSGFCLSVGKDRTRLYLADSMAGRKPYLKSFVSEVLVPEGWNANFLEDIPSIENAISSLSEELDRQESLSGQLPDPAFLVIGEPNRFRQLCRDEEGGKTQLGEKLDDLISRGSQYGIHVIETFVSLEYVRKLYNRFDRFHHKLMTEMSDIDSINFIGSKDAARIQSDYIPPVGVYRGPDIKKLKFKAYSFDEEEFDSEIEALRTIMKS